MLNIYCAGCGETLGKTSDNAVAAAANDTIYCEDCVDQGVADAQDTEVENASEEDEEETDEETVEEEEK